MENSFDSVEKPVKRKLRWFYPTPGRLLLFLLPLLGMLLTLSRLQWISPLWAGLIAVVSVFFVICFSIFWYSVDLLHRWQTSPGRLIFGLFLAEAMLLLLNWFNLFPKGWAVLLVTVSVTIVIFFLPFWYSVSFFRHWHFQYSIRSMLLLLLVVAVSVNWLVVEIREANTQAEAVSQLDGRGDAWYDDYPSIYGPFGFFVEVLGKDFFANVHAVQFYDFPTRKGHKITAADWESLKKLKHLDNLYIRYTTLPDIDLENIKEIKHLTGLGIGEANLTDTSLEHLKDAKQLRWLMLDTNQITDAGLEHLKELTQLEELNVRYNKVTDDGVAKLQKELPNTHLMW